MREDGGVRARFTTALGVVVLSLGLGWATASAEVTAQAPPTVPASACGVSGTVPSTVVNGPSPTGRCEPGGKQRAIDTFVWLFLVGLLGLLAVIGVVVLVRSLRADRTVAAS